MNGLSAIPLGIPFLPALVRGLIDQTSSDPLSLARYLVILPTQRGCLALSKAFIDATPTGCRILPRIMALADIEEGADLPGYLPPEILPPAMPAWQRLGLLSQLVLAFEKQHTNSVANPAGAIRLAQELMRLVDEVETTGLNLADLKTLVDADYAAHWQLTLDFLKILTDLWPPILAQAGYIEPAARRRLILEQITTHWRPAYPVILAGTTGSRPATALLAKSILSFGNGNVVLPGVDFAAHNGEILPPTHPQYTLSCFISQLGKPALWPGCDPVPSSRASFLSQAMTAIPDENWRISWQAAKTVTATLQAIEASSILEEARQIALIMRYELETPGQVIAFVTPDAELTRRVQAALGRWGLHANLSGGLPLIQSVVGRFLLLSSQLTDDMTAADLLALLKHPLTQKGRDRLNHLIEARQFETKVLRGLNPTHPQKLPFPGHEMGTPLLALGDGKPHAFADFLKIHKEVAEALVGDNDLLWGEEDGQVATDFWQALQDQAASFPPLTARDYPGVLRNLMAQEVVRDVQGIGSRLLILGALEARLLQADVVILGGLNEGTWPGAAADDPWLSRPMRISFGLPPLERKIGLSAHDFCTAMSVQKIYMTRALRRNGSPTLASRWIQRLSALLATGGEGLVAPSSWSAWSRALDAPAQQITFLPPAPCPSLEVRPRRLSVTAVETLLRDPYSIYAKSILRLRPLDPLNQDLSMMERGQAIHQALDAFVRSGVDPESPQAMETLSNLGREAFGDLFQDPRTMAFWWPRFQRLSAWFLQKFSEESPYLQGTQTEREGAIDIPTANGFITLTAKADRIDIMSSGLGRIIDYKTGSLPSVKSVVQGYVPQLPLEGLILKVGGFADLPPLGIEALCYWGVTGGSPAGEIRTLKDPADLIAAAESGVRCLFEAFFGHETPFYACPDPFDIPAYHHYAHLERLKEWGMS
jgi:ATP-dependent helicase/nuclease subunit B